MAGQQPHREQRGEESYCGLGKQLRDKTKQKNNPNRVVFFGYSYYSVIGYSMGVLGYVMLCYFGYYFSHYEFLGTG